VLYVSVFYTIGWTNRASGLLEKLSAVWPNLEKLAN